MKIFVFLSLMFLVLVSSIDERTYQSYQKEVESSYKELSSVMKSLSQSISDQTKQSDTIANKMKILSMKASLIEEYISNKNTKYVYKLT